MTNPDAVFCSASFAFTTIRSSSGLIEIAIFVTPLVGYLRFLKFLLHSPGALISTRRLRVLKPTLKGGLRLGQISALI
jgi:hypothetical protein